MHQFCTAGYFATAQYDRCIFVTGLPRRAILALLAMTAYIFFRWILILLHGFN
ncbi:MAG: hypothetical protein K6C94_07235 [Candidatus Gastranaerophilales bacterium]|nr:hypothetical protein [Candidatus Gastranaerophilales bacterium]